MKIRLAIVIFTTLIFLCADILWAYDGKVHSKINEAAVNSSQSDSVLKDQLGILNGKEALLTKGTKTQEVWKWIAVGGEAEDFGWLGKYDIPRTRAFNHFHDPLKNWGEAGLDNAFLAWQYGTHYERDPVSLILWGLAPDQQNFPENSTGDWSWEKAREYYYVYLTGKDFEGNVVADTDDEREENFADCFRAAGQVMHLLQDASVPLHTRNYSNVYPTQYTRKG